MPLEWFRLYAQWTRAWFKSCGNLTIHTTPNTLFGDYSMFFNKLLKQNFKPHPLGKMVLTTNVTVYFTHYVQRSMLQWLIHYVQRSDLVVHYVFSDLMAWCMGDFHCVVHQCTLASSGVHVVFCVYGSWHVPFWWVQDNPNLGQD